MSAGPASKEGHAPGYRAIRFNMDWITRPLFGVLLAAIALFAVGSGAAYVAVLAGIGLALAAFEWHRCVGQGKFHGFDVAITAFTVFLTEGAYLITGHIWAGLLVVIAGTAAGFGWAKNQEDSHPYWRALGTLYLALPALCLVALCGTQKGALTVGCMLVIVWFTDIGALVFGNLIGGPRLAPKISPGKTWAGTIGGSLSAALAFFAVSLLFVPSNGPVTALIFGFLFSFVAHAGDLFESLVKRRFDIKDSGSIIPGHGGVLDRIDSTLAASAVMALFVFGLHFNPVLWDFGMIPIATTRLFDETPGLDAVLARHVTVLGSTGSIGVNTIDVIAHARKQYGGHAFPVMALTAGGNVEKLIGQARALKPRRAVIGDPSLYDALQEGLAGTGIETAAGRQAVIEAAAMPSDFVMVAIMGAAAIEPALAAIRRGVIVALANKECVVAAGEVFHDALSKSGAHVIPVDSEHNAIFQVLGSGDASEVDVVTITASGGPFREWPLEKMRAATVEQAVAHPNWAMGRKISLDSATLMNKGLELIEAHFLFALPPEKLAVLVHPQSIVHCLVSYDDGTTMAHLSAPDMRTPIAHALGWPRRIASPSRRLDLAGLGQLVFQAPAHDRFPALGLAIDSMKSGGLAPTVLNAANEIAVQAFLDRRIGFLDISRVVGATLDADNGSNGVANDLDTVLGTDARARVLAEEICQRVGT